MKFTHLAQLSLLAYTTSAYSIHLTGSTVAPAIAFSAVLLQAPLGAALAIPSLKDYLGFTTLSRRDNSNTEASTNVTNGHEFNTTSDAGNGTHHHHHHCHNKTSNATTGNEQVADDGSQDVDVSTTKVCTHTGNRDHNSSRTQAAAEGAATVTVTLTEGSSQSQAAVTTAGGSARPSNTAVSTNTVAAQTTQSGTQAAGTLPSDFPPPSPSANSAVSLGYREVDDDGVDVADDTEAVDTSADTTRSSSGVTQSKGADHNRGRKHHHVSV